MKEAGFNFCHYDPAPHSGDGCVRITYHEKFFYYDDNGGCVAYYTKLKEPLKVGHVYKLEMWVYAPTSEGVEKAIYNNFGMLLTLKPRKSPLIVPAKFFFGEVTIFDKWHKQEYYIRAQCPLKYITIGAYGNESFPLLCRSHNYWTDFFVDDISVIAVNEDSLSENIIPTPYCEYFEKEVINPYPPITSASVYFENQEFILDSFDYNVIDSFIYYSELGPNMVYVLSGHTDNRGTENYELSHRRTNAVIDYIQSEFNLPKYSLLSFSKGDENPIYENDSEENRAKNRRVTIRTSHIKRESVLYREALKSLKNKNWQQALNQFNSWLLITDKSHRAVILHDPRIVKYADHGFRRKLYEKIKLHYNEYSFPELSLSLDSLYFSDQKYRTWSPYELTGFVKGLDSLNKQISTADERLERWVKTDSLNLVCLKSLLDKHGFPKISDVGRRQVKSAVYILAHSQDTAAMKKYLPILKDRCLEAEAETIHYAILSDKLSVRRNKPQKYGTQYETSHDTGSPIGYYLNEGIDEVNKNRRQIGLNPTPDF